MQKVARNEKMARKTRSCQIIAKQFVESRSFSFTLSHFDFFFFFFLFRFLKFLKEDNCLSFKFHLEEFKLFLPPAQELVRFTITVFINLPLFAWFDCHC